MPPGYNHNVCYRNRIYHAQTEACGNDEPLIVTHLFLQGMVVASLRYGYQELLSDPDLDEKLPKAMQEQHKEILRQLRRGEYDARVSELLQALQPTQISAAPDLAEQVPLQPLTRSGLQPLAHPSSLQPEPSLQEPTAQELADDSLTEAEEWIFERGRNISRVVGAIPVAGGRIPYDHPAFEGFPMLELDLDSDEELELDLDAISGFDLTNERDQATRDACVTEAASEQRAARFEEQAASPSNMQRRKPPSLPLAPVAIELPEGIDTRPHKDSKGR